MSNKLIPALPAELLEQWASEWANGTRVVSIPTSLDEMTFATAQFLPLALLHPDDAPANLAGVTELVSKAAPRAINGQPIFFSCSYVPYESAVDLVERAKELFSALPSNAVTV